MTDLYCVVNRRGEALSKPLPRITAEHFLATLTHGNRAAGRRTTASIVPEADAINEQRLVLELSIEQAQASGALPGCFAPKPGVRFELHAIMPT